MVTPTPTFSKKTMMTVKMSHLGMGLGERVQVPPEIFPHRRNLTPWSHETMQKVNEVGKGVGVVRRAGDVEGWIGGCQFFLCWFNCSWRSAGKKCRWRIKNAGSNKCHLARKKNTKWREKGRESDKRRERIMMGVWALWAYQPLWVT